MSDERDDPQSSAAAQWERLLHLNEHLLAGGGGLAGPDASASAAPAAAGAPPAVPALTAEIEQARDQFRALTVELSALEGRLDRGEPVAAEEIGGALDKARAWVEYLGPSGPLRRGFPPFTPPTVYIDALARISELQRVAQQWVDALAPRWQRISSAPQAHADAEQQCLELVARAEQSFSTCSTSFTLSSSGMSSAQIEERLREVDQLLASVRTLAAGATGECRSRADALVARIEGSRAEVFEFTLRSRRAWEDFQRQQGGTAGSGGAAGAGGTGRPGPGSPEWYAAVSGMNCYWCGWSFVGLPQPVFRCPHCGMFPEPHS